jgi:hypothetical protein
MISSIGIPSANTRSVSDAASTLPSMSGTITGWFRPLVLGRVTKSIVDGETKEAVFEQRCQGVIQPFDDRKLKVKPEGQRSWNWQMLHTTPNVKLRNDEEFKIKGTPYRVMSQKDYSEYGYVTYELVQDYTGVLS